MRDLSILYSVHRPDHMAGALNGGRISFYDLTIVIKGTLNYTIDDKSYVINSGDAILAPAGCRIWRAKGEARANYASFNFTSSEPIDLPIKIDKCVDSTLMLLIELHDDLVKRSHFRREIKAKSLLNMLIAHLEDHVKSDEYHPLTLKIIDYIHSHLKQKITLEDICKKTFFSPGYCEVVFKADTGRAINDYLINARIEEAKRLLSGSTRKLDKISESVGFDDYNYFARIFKRRTGHTPTEYRKIMFDQRDKTKNSESL